MRSIILGSVASLMLAGTAAHATTVYNTALPAVNTTVGDGVAVTTTDANGTVTTVTGSGGPGNRVSAPLALDSWLQSNVGGNASVGITKERPQSGNGSVAFTGLTANNSKADLEYYFSAPLTLADFAGASYDWFRSSASTTNGIQTASFRFLVNDASLSLPLSTYLIFEPYYQGAPANVATDQWVTSSIDGDSIFWNNNGALTNGSTGLFSSLDSIIAANPDILVYGLSVGIGSGWSGTFFGGVDNISYDFGARSDSFNFEVAPVPEPATWTMLISGFALAGAAMRRRSRQAVPSHA